MPAPPTVRLALEDGAVYVGEGFGAAGDGLVATAEVVFNTAMSGYQESMTDPSYTGQILVQTAPLIGNTGVNAEDVESGKVAIAGLAVRELARRHSNYRATGDLSSYLGDAGVLGLSGVDTRAITKRIRTTGALRGVLTDRADLPDAELVQLARVAPSMAGANLVDEVARERAEEWETGLGEWKTPSVTLEDSRDTSPTGGGGGRPLRVLAIDCGAKLNILRNLAARGCAVTVIPHTTPAGEIREWFDSGRADGLFVSNGPGDPAAVEQIVATLRDLISSDDPVPTFGICLGHQLLSLGAGATTYKLKFGHRGANQPVLDRTSGRVEITSQNHGFAVEPESLEAAGGEVTHVNLNDGTVAGFRLRGRPVFAVQHHPEASPGPHDAGYLFDRFIESMRAREHAGRG